MGTNFYYYLNRQGVQGLQGPKGKDGEPGISPTIQIKENTGTEFTLEITDANGTFETPNLRIPILDKGGTYYRVDRTDGTLYLDFADKADINTFGEVKLATADTVDNPDPDDVRVVTDEILHDKIVDINNDITLANNEIIGLKAVDVVLDGKITDAITKAEEDLALAEVELTVEINKKQDKLIEGENVTLTPTVNGVVISATGGGGTADVPIATTRVAGKVKPDGTTITVTTDGTITAKDTTYTVNAPITMTNNKIGIAIDNQTIQNVNGVLHANFDELADDVIANTQAINTLSGRVDGVEADIEGLGDEIALKQDTLVSGTNIKTINGMPLLGEGNIEIQGGGGEPIPQTPNVITVGNPTINNGMATGFTTTDYLQFPVILDLQGKPFQIDFAFTTGGNVTTQQNIIDSKFGIALAIANGKGLMAISSNGTNWDIGTAAGTINIAANTTYYARLTWDGTTYRTLLSTDGNTYNQDMQLAGTNRPFPTTIYIGGCDTAGTGHTAHPFGGTIDLNKAFIYVAGQLFWHGMDNVGLESRADINLGNITEEGKQVIRDTVDVSGKEDKLTAVAPVYIQDKTIETAVGLTIRTDNIIVNKAIRSVDTNYRYGNFSVSSYVNWGNTFPPAYIELPFNIDNNVLTATQVTFNGIGMFAFGHYEGDTFVEDVLLYNSRRSTSYDFFGIPSGPVTKNSSFPYYYSWHCDKFTDGAGSHGSTPTTTFTDNSQYGFELGEDVVILWERQFNGGSSAGYRLRGLTEEQVNKVRSITSVRLLWINSEDNLLPKTYTYADNPFMDTNKIAVYTCSGGHTPADLQTNVPTVDIINIGSKVTAGSATTQHIIGIDTTALPSPDVKVDNTTIEVNGNGELQTTVDINNLETRVEALEQGGGGGGDVTASGDNTFSGTNNFDGPVTLNNSVYNEGYLTFNNNGFWIKDDNNTEWHVTTDTTGALNIDGTPINSGVIDAYESGTEGYRVYQKDQTGYYYCEQWGLTSSTQVQLLKTFPDTDYNIQLTSEVGSAYAIQYKEKTNDKFGLHNYQQTYNGVNWKVTGYLPEEEALGE